MAGGIDSKFYFLLYPISLVYGVGVWIRNKLFDDGILKEHSFDIPVICVGNLTVGGTGKTPFIEYLVSLLKSRYKVAVVSRGYRRKTKGFVLSDANHSFADIGDEPFQIKRKFDDIIVAVDADRCNAISQLLRLPLADRPDVILLDDAFQHRYVKPSLTILLTDYHRPFYNDEMLPCGRLRESASGSHRADVVVVTKSTQSMKPIDYRIIESDMALQAHQALFFSYILYGELKSLFSNETLPRQKLKDYSVLAVSGIASPVTFNVWLGEHARSVTSLTFPDHHEFDEHDLKSISDSFNSIQEKDKLIVMTEKDAARLIDNDYLCDELKPYCYFLPISIDFLQNRKGEFDNLVLKHINRFRLNE